MSKDKIKKEIEDNINIRNNFWNALLITTGGSLTLLINLDNFMKIILLIIGVFFILVFLKGYFYRVEFVQELTKKLEDK